jgi:hypothetical protein
MSLLTVAKCHVLHDEHGVGLPVKGGQEHIGACKRAGMHGANSVRNASWQQAASLAHRSQHVCDYLSDGYERMMMTELRKSCRQRAGEGGIHVYTHVRHPCIDPYVVQVHVCARATCVHLYSGPRFGLYAIPFELRGKGTVYASHARASVVFFRRASVRTYTRQTELTMCVKLVPSLKHYLARESGYLACSTKLGGE